MRGYRIKTVAEVGGEVAKDAVSVQFKTSFDTRFSWRNRVSSERKSGTDAGLPSEARKYVVVWLIPDANGVQGFAGSNPAVPIGEVEALPTLTWVELFF